MTVSLNRTRKILHRSSSVYLLLLFFLGNLFMTSCEEDPTTIGKNLLPASDYLKIEATDTLKPVSYTMYDDTISSSLPLVGYLGQTRDPYFGTTKASFVTQLRLLGEWDGLPYILDSVKLVLKLTVAGTSTAPQILTISEISDQIYTTSTYSSKTNVSLSGFSTSVTLPELKPDTINTIVVSMPDLSFANRIFQDTSMLFHSNVIPDFRSYFKGLYFTLSSTGEPVFASLDLLNNPETGGVNFLDNYYKNYFLIYYHSEEGDTSASGYPLMIDAINRNASFNKIEHDFTTADPDKVIENYNDLSFQDTLTYMQSLNGLYTRIILPGLSEIKSSGNFDRIAVSKAHLTLPFYYDNNTYKLSDLPSQLYLRYRTADGKRWVVPEIDLDAEFFGGVIDTVNHVYKFNIATFAQNYLEDTSGNILPELEVMQPLELKNLILKANESRTPPTFDFAYIRF
ncbi:MAG TPA: DUF4270 family protein [Bacteroidales bacterium]|nr:DUF4270 family protein [Bacteroidales bacterium]